METMNVPARIHATQAEELLDAMEVAWKAQPMGQRPASRGERSRAGEARWQVLSSTIAEVLSSQARPGDTFPGERVSAERLGVSRTTLRSALDSLVTEGALERIPGSGTFVPRRPRAPRVGLTSFSEDMRLRGMVPSTRVLRFESAAATGWLAREMQLETGAPLVYLQRLLLADGQPIAVDENYLPSARLPGLAALRAPSSLYDLLKTNYGIVPEYGEDQVEAIAASPVQARLLNIGAGDPLLQVVRYAYAGEDLINYSAVFYRADRYRLNVPLSRSHRG